MSTTFIFIILLLCLFLKPSRVESVHHDSSIVDAPQELDDPKSPVSDGVQAPQLELNDHDASLPLTVSALLEHDAEASSALKREFYHDISRAVAVRSSKRATKRPSAPSLRSPRDSVRAVSASRTPPSVNSTARVISVLFRSAEEGSTPSTSSPHSSPAYRFNRRAATQSRSTSSAPGSTPSTSSPRSSPACRFNRRAATQSRSTSSAPGLRRCRCSPLAVTRWTATCWAPDLLRCHFSPLAVTLWSARALPSR
ncbi:hypothetical protein K438DRAFT_978675 [Mycena galopus ATCC 62051]|nr:hypothetical protein K438DRAFT_978675 [Mycena galopus ATCC 62051]